MPNCFKMDKMIKEREEVAAIIRRLYDKGLTTASGGNVSMRVDDLVLITPSQIDKATVRGEQIIMLDMDSNILGEGLRKSMETGMHLAIYKKRPDVKAIVHAHPVMATSFAISRKKIKSNMAGESRAILGEPAFAPYALMGTPQLAENVSNSCKNADVVLMENHGVIALGDTLFQAYDRLEVLEACARMTLVTQLLGNAHELNDEQVEEIDKLFNR